MIKKQNVLLTILVIVLIILVSLFLSFTLDEKELFTAMEGKEIADDVAKNWSMSATLVSIRKSGSVTNQYQIQSWYYLYRDSLNDSRPHNILEIKVNIMGYFERIYEDWSSPNILIENWSIDSDNAYEIAMTNEQIKIFIGHNPTIDGFTLSSGSGQAVWYIQWTYNAGFDNPKWAQIQIDATTGEVLYVEVDN